MSLRKILLTGTLAFGVCAAAPSRASADWLFTPFIGSNFGGSANIGGAGEDFSDEFERKLNYGASLAWMGGGIMGFEVDFGYSPNFFQVSPDNGSFNLVGDGNVTTLMANVVVGAPIGGVRPYASGGLGLIKSKVDDVGQFFGEISNNDLGFDIGGGVIGFFSDNVGVRGDIRYFRSLHDSDPNGIDLDLGNFDFWRGTVGVTFRF
jgi:opacity protein-like surface antigen